MFRNAIVSAVALVIFVGAAAAGEVQGRLVKVDAEKNTITINTARRGEEAKEKTYTIAKDAKFIQVKMAARGEKPTEETLKDGLKNDAFKTPAGGRGGARITLTTKGEGDKEEAVEVKVSAGGRRRPNQ